MMMVIEFRKQKKKHGFLFLAAALAMSYFYLFDGMSYKSSGQEWLEILYYIPLINTLILSILMSILASHTIDVEHKGAMWNLLPTLETRTSIYFGKLLYGLVHLLIFCTAQMSMVLLMGIHLGFPSPFPLGAMGKALVAELVSGMIIFQVQCLLSFLFSNQFAALSAGFGGTFAGLFLAYISSRSWIPWSVLLSLRTVDLDFQKMTQTMSLTWRSPDGLDLIIALFYFLASLLIGLWCFTKSEPGETWIRTSSTKASSSLHSKLPPELLKLKHNPVWIAFFLLPGVSALIGTSNFLQNQSVLSFTWEDLWTQQSLFLGLFFLAPLVGILCSLLWRMEHQGSNWNLILTICSPVKLVLDKWISAVLLSSLCMIWIMALYLATGKLLGIPGAIPHTFWLRMAGSILCLASIAALQSTLSLVFHSFALPVALSFAGSIVGIGLTVKGWYYATPFSLLVYGMGSTSISGEFHLLPLLLSCLFYIGIALTFSILYLKKSDIRTLH